MALILQYLGKKVPLAYLAPAIAMAPGVALYAGFFSCYNRLMAESGFPKAAQAIRAVWKRGDHDAATDAVPDALIDAPRVVGTLAECRERLEASRRSGIALPLISPFCRVPDSTQRALEAIRACAPCLQPGNPAPPVPGLRPSPQAAARVQPQPAPPRPRPWSGVLRIKTPRQGS